MVKEARLRYVDVARGIAMFIIVLSHAISSPLGYTYPIYRVLFFVNVPIFFVLSGYMFRIKEGETFLLFLKKKFLRIMLPYFFWALVFLVPYFIFGKDIINQFSQKSSFALFTQIRNVFYGNGVNNALKQNGPLWFLPALFTTEVLFYYIVYFVRNRKAEVGVFIGTVLIGFLCTTLFAEKFYLPWGLNTALTIGGFFYFGYLLKEWKVLSSFQPKKSAILFVICAAFSGIAIMFNEPENVIWTDYQYLNYCLTMVVGITSSLAIMIISKWIGQNKVIEYVGRNTMSILIYHKMIIVVAQTKLGVFSRLLMDSDVATGLCFGLIVSVMAIAISVFVGRLIRRVLPELIGERGERHVAKAEKK